MFLIVKLGEPEHGVCQLGVESSKAAFCCGAVQCAVGGQHASNHLAAGDRKEQQAVSIAAHRSQLPSLEESRSRPST
jgi:hypothetical protein